MPEKPNPFPEMYLLAGFTCITVGAAWIYRPAGLIVAGVFLFCAAMFGKKRGS